MTTPESFENQGEYYIPEPINSVLTEEEFLRDFEHSAKLPKRGRVFSKAMIFFPDDKGRAVASAIKGASSSVERTLVIDAYSELTLGNKVISLARLNPLQSAEINRMQEDYSNILEDLAENGVDVNVINRPEGGVMKRGVKYVFPFLGTDHTKGTYVFDQDVHEKCEAEGIPDSSTVFYLHTSNHEDEPRMNMVIKFGGPLAYALKEEYDSINEDPPEEDYNKQLNEDTWLYVDSGKRGKSIILDKAVDLIGDAEESVRVVTVMTPDGPFANALNRKYTDWRKEDDTREFDIITTEFPFEMPFQTVGGTFWAVDQVSRLQSKLQGLKFPVMRDSNRWAHAKCLIVDDKWLFIGSMNFAWSGVKAGTREWQLLTKDPEVVQGALKIVKEYKSSVVGTTS